MGFIGSHLIDRLLQLNEFVICVDNFSSGSRSNFKRWNSNNKFKFLEEDILNLRSIKCDRIWHLACPASPIHYQLNPIKTTQTSFLGTYNMLNLAKEKNARIGSASPLHKNALSFMLQRTRPLSR